LPTQRTQKTLAHENDSADRTISIGQPFNFYAMSSGPMIHWAIVKHPALCPGSKLFWGLLRSWGKQKGICYARIEKLAERMGVSYNTICRYRSELQAAGLLRVVERTGHTNEWTLLLAPCFLEENAYEGPRKLRARKSLMGGVPPSNGGSQRNHLKEPPKGYKRVVSSSIDISVGPDEPNDDDDALAEVRSDRSRRAWQTHAQAAISKASAEREALDRRDVVAIVQGHCNCLPDEALIDTVMRELSKAKMTPTQLNAELEDRIPKLAEAPRPAFVVFLAKQYASGRYKAAAPVIKRDLHAAPQLETKCLFCDCPYGAGVCGVDPEGEILATAHWRTVCPEYGQDDGWSYTSCPVCTFKPAAPAE